jgi:hypothetical protein
VIDLTIVCAGYVLATRNLWIAIAKLVYCFNVEFSEVPSFALPSLSSLYVFPRQSRPTAVSSYLTVGCEKKYVG